MKVKDPFQTVDLLLLSPCAGPGPGGPVPIGVAV